MTLIVCLSVAPASAEESEGLPGGVLAALRAELLAHPSGTVDGSTILYPDGTTFVAVEAGELSISQCPAGQFCGWANASYTGSFHATSGTGVTRTLTWSAKSYRNNRSQAARLYGSGGTVSTCFAPGEARATIGSSYHTPAKVVLSATMSC